MAPKNKTSKKRSTCRSGKHRNKITRRCRCRKVCRTYGGKK